MDEFKFTTVGHRHMALCSPLSEARLGALIDVLDLPTAPRVLDLCSGKADLALRLLERYGGSAMAVDRNPHFIAEARAQAVARVPPGALDAIVLDVAEFETTDTFDLVICVGARPFGDRLANLQRLARFARAGGQLLIGEGYWRSPPDPAYVRFLDESDGEIAIRFHDHIEMAAREGLISLYAIGSSVEEFDHYDGAYAASIERYVAEVPDDPDAAALLARIRSWREAFVKWGRTTMGFGWYLYATQR